MPNLDTLGVAFLVLGINLALKYTVGLEAKQNPRAEIYARRIAMSVLVLAIVSFLGTLVLNGHPSNSGLSLAGGADNSQTVALLRMAFIFCGSFSAVFALAGLPLAELARHHSSRRKNTEKMDLERQIDANEKKSPNF